MAGTLTCGQCHIEYVCGQGADRDTTGEIRDHVPWRKLTDIEEHYQAQFGNEQEPLCVPGAGHGATVRLQPVATCSGRSRKVEPWPLRCSRPWSSSQGLVGIFDLARAVVEHIARGLAEDPDAIDVDLSERRGEVLLLVHANPDDMGRLIGRRGRVIQAMRQVARAAGAAEGVKATVDVAE